MHLLIGLLLILLVLFGRFSFGGSQPSIVEVRVRVAESVPRLRIRGFDLKIESRQSGIFQKSVFSDRMSEWEFDCQSGKVQARKLTSNNELGVDLGDSAVIRTPTGFLNLENQPYRNELKIYALKKSIKSQCDVINSIELEKYLDGLVNSEFSSKWSKEAVAAQVIAARTYAFYQIQAAQTQKLSYFDLDATTQDQVYNGSMKEDFHASQVVEATRGWVLTTGTHELPQPIKAFYHSTCGGVTELPKEVWGVSYPGFKRSVSCSYCMQSPRYQWSLEMNRTQLLTAIHKGVEKNGFPVGWPSESLEVLQQGVLKDLQIESKNPQGRVQRVITHWGDGHKLFISGTQFREWIGVSQLRSTAFQVRSLGEKGWRFEGKGSGHGVGLCQWGAKVMGEKGLKSDRILRFYYPDAVLRKLW